MNVTIEYWPRGLPLKKIRRNLYLRHASRRVLRRTVSYVLPSPGAYEVRVRRVETVSANRYIQDDVVWAALRSYQADTAAYPGQTRLGLRVRASGQLSGRLERLSALVRQKIPVWDGNQWTAPQASSNPAWLFRWYCRGVTVNGRLAAGAGLPVERIDEAGLKAWGAWCDAQALTCNLVIERAMTHYEVLTIIAQCGRASPSWQTGKLGVVWEAPDTPVTALVTPGNIIAGSFKVEWEGGKSADEIVCRYVEPDLDWQWNTVRRAVPGAPASGRAATLTLAGVTDRAQAAKECNLTAARQRYHRRKLTWEMGAEGTAVPRGSVVRLTHGLIDGGVAGRLTGGTPARLVLDPPVRFRGAAGYETGGVDKHHLLLRLPDGELHSSAISHPDGAGAGGETDTVVLESPLPAAPDANGSSPADTLWRLYSPDGPVARARIVSVEPLDERRIRFTAIDEVDEYHQAAVSDLSVTLPALTSREVRVVAIAISEQLIRAGPGYAVELTATVTVAGPWRGGVVQAALDGGELRTVATMRDGETQASWFSPPEGLLTVTVLPGAEAAPLSAGSFAVSYRILGKLAPPGAPSNFLIDVLGDGTRRLRWTPPGDADLAGILIRYAGATGPGADPPAWDAMTPLHTGPLTASPIETNSPGPGTWLFAARAIDTSGLLSEATHIRAELPDPRLGDTLLWTCPSAEGWPGTVENAVHSNDGLDALEGEGDYAWAADIATWDDWASWSLGDGDDGATAMTYTARAENLGAAIAFGLNWQGDANGELAFQARTGGTEVELEAAPFADHAAGVSLTARFVQPRWRLTGDGSTLLRLDHLCWSVLAPTREERIRDADTSAWAGSAAAGRQIPTALATVVDVDLTLQSVGAGWSWSLESKSPPTVKLFDGAGQPADATVDAVVRGVAAT